MRILLATDGSESAEAALDALVSFPFPSDSELTVLTVVDSDIFRKEEASGITDEQKEALQETEQIVQEEARELLLRESARLGEAGWSESSELRIGHPAEEIVRAAEQLDIDCIVVGSHGLSGIKRFLLGSVSDHVLQSAHCSVLIVKKPGLHPDQSGTAHERPASTDRAQRLRMLLTYDDSAPSQQAVEFCVSLPLHERADVIVLTVLPLVTMYRQDIRQRLSWLWLEKKKEALIALERAKQEISRVTPHVDAQLREAPDPSDEILHAASEFNSDVIVLGHKGKGAIEKFLLGSVTTRIAHHATCSVLAIRKD